MDIETEYQDVLQNIEFAIVSVYHEQPELLDYDVETVLAALIQAYRAEQSQRPAKPPALNPLRQELYSRVHHMCEFRLGREDLSAAGGPEPELVPVGVDVMILCLKRIRKSVKTWSKQGGRRGYLSFIEQYVF